MREMSLKEIQDVSLEILKDVCSFCESHDINYSLAYGTMIGAIRHHGFIPWDDDADILIPRPDFERFCQEYKSYQGYKLYKPGDPNYYLSYAHVCDMNTLVTTNHPWSKDKTGIWIDVLPLDGLPSDEEEFLNMVKAIRGIQKKVYRLRTGRYLKLSETQGIMDFCKCLIKRFLYSLYNMDDLLSQHYQLLISHDYEKSEYYGQLCVMDYPEKEHNPKVDYESCVKRRFCDSYFYIFNGFDNILTRYYGNYMELPPEEKRVAPESSTQKYYWK